MSDRDAFVKEFRDVQPKFSRFYAHILEKVNLTLPQYVLLNQLHLSGTISMTEMSRRLNLTKPAITHLVDKLEEKKLLKRVHHTEDRRIILLEILEKGEKKVSGIHSYSLQMLLTAYDQFNKDEQKIVGRFYAAMSKILDNRLLEISK